MGVYVYVDGFNFYYRLFKNRHRKHALPRGYKWLNIYSLCCALLPGEQIDWIGYFTAYVKPTPNDPFQHERQRAYLEALRTIPCLEIIPGNFLSVKKWGIPVGANPPAPVEFTAFEEKGSDVNLAFRLVLHAARGAFSQAVIFTNDGDLREPIRMVAQDLKLPIKVVSPDTNVNGSLRNVATSSMPLNTKVLKNCLFPDQILNSDGVTISKPVRLA